MKLNSHIISHPQGSEAWAQHRAASLNASDLAAAMGLSKYQTRSELIERLATGITPEVDAMTQARFDKGHANEAAAEPKARTAAKPKAKAASKKPAKKPAAKVRACESEEGANVCAPLVQ